MRLPPTPLGDAFEQFQAGHLPAACAQAIAAGKPELATWWIFMAGWGAAQAHAVRHIAGADYGSQSTLHFGGDAPVVVPPEDPE